MLMQRMGWSWPQLLEAPLYVRQFCADFLAMQDDAQDTGDE